MITDNQARAERSWYLWQGRRDDDYASLVLTANEQFTDSEAQEEALAEMVYISQRGKLPMWAKRVRGFSQDEGGLHFEF